MNKPNPSPSEPRCVEILSTDRSHPVRERIRVSATARAPLGPMDVRIGMLAMSVLPADLLQMNGQYGYQPPVPYIPGHEGVAVVLETGTGVSDLGIGDRVIPLGVFGLWADERVVRRQALAVVPAHGDALQQAMLSANPATAWVMLQHLVAVQPGEWVIQNAANSAVGQCVRQLAKHLGIALINVVRREDAIPHRNRDDTTEYWIADGGVAPSTLQHKVRAIAKEAPVVLGLDAIGGSASSAMASALSPGGLLSVYGMLSGEPCQVATEDLLFRRIAVRGFWLAQWFSDPANRTAAKAVFPSLMALDAIGLFKMNVEAVYDLDDVCDAVAHAAREQRGGKVLLSGKHFKPDN